MVRGLYIGTSGMLGQWNQMNVVANNLANINTTAYKKDEAIFKSFPEMLLRRLDDNGVVKLPNGSFDVAPLVGKIGTGVELNDINTRLEQGSFKNTENDFDLALAGKGYFVIKTPTGEKYTRNGSFLIDKDSYLVTKDGFRVQGEQGDIRIKTHNFKVDEFGSILVNREFPEEDLGAFTDKSNNDWKEPVVKDRLRIVNFYDESQLKKVGNSFYQATKQSGEAEDKVIGQGRAQILQGYIETSNVNPVIEMTKMIEVQRSYEANQKVVTSNDQLLQKAVNEIPKV